MRRAAKVDANQSEIISALRKIGCTVFPLSNVGKGMGDILIGYREKNVLLELKDGSKPPSARRLTPDQIIFRSEWRGQYDVVENVEQAISVVTRETIK